MSLYLGYGHIVPLTPVGKIVTIFYAVLGVPLFLLYLSNIGKLQYNSIFQHQLQYNNTYSTSTTVQ